MRTVTIERRVYSADDLRDNPEVMKRVLEKHRYWHVQDDWWEFVYDNFKTDTLTDTCFTCKRIQFSGFWSQGDGAMFEGSFLLDYDTDLALIELYVPDKRICRLIKAGRISVSGDFKHYGHYYHEKSYTHNFVVETYGNHHNDDCICNYLDSGILERKIRDDYECLCKDLYRSLESEYEALVSDEYLLESFRENEIGFYADGSICNE